MLVLLSEAINDLYVLGVVSGAILYSCNFALLFSLHFIINPFNTNTTLTKTYAIIRIRLSRDVVSSTYSIDIARIDNFSI